MAREYEVLSDRLVGHKKGDRITGPVHPGLVGAHLRELQKPEEIACPICQEQGKAADKKRTYSSADKLAEHYADAHPAFAPPAPEEV